jgi:hypothetical protein
MTIRIQFHDDALKQNLMKAAAEGLKRAGVFFHSACVRVVNKGNPYRHRVKFAPKQSAARGGQKTGTVYENRANEDAGQPPFKRTGFGQSNIVFEFNEDPLAPAVRVGVRKNALYLIFLDLGTSRIRPRPWLLETYKQHETEIKRLALSGFKK